MTDSSDQTLAASVERLNDTASSLTALMRIVDKNQKLLVDTQAATLENTDAISLRSTKEELVAEVDRLAGERKKDRTKTKISILASLLISGIFIGATAYTTNEFRNARHEANIEYSQAAKSVCEQRNETWAAMTKWLKAERGAIVQNSVILPVEKAEQLAAYDELLSSLPIVDCNIAALLVGQAAPAGLGNANDNSALSVFTGQ